MDSCQATDKKKKPQLFFIENCFLSFFYEAKK